MLGKVILLLVVVAIILLLVYLLGRFLYDKFVSDNAKSKAELRELINELKDLKNAN